MGTPLQLRNINDLLFGYAESSAYRNPFVYNPDFSLDSEPDVSVIIRRDARMGARWDKRAKMIVREWHLDKPRKSKDEADQQMVDICEEALAQIEFFDAARYRLAEATILGRGYEFIGGRIIDGLELGGTKPMAWWVPKTLTNVDRRRMRWAPVWDYKDPKNPKMHVIQEFWSVVRQKWEPLTPTEADHFIRYIPYQAEERLHYGLPLLEAAFFTHYLKTVSIEKAGEGVDRWANGMLIAEIKGLRNASTGKTNEDLKAGAIAMLQKMRTEHAGVIEVGDKVTAVEPTGTGHQMTSWMIERCDDDCDLLFTGSVFSHGKAGSRAKDEVQADQGEAYVQYERGLQDEVTSRQLVNLFIRVNWANFVELGLDKAKLPRFTSAQQERIDPEKWVTTAGQLLDRGLPMVKEELYRKAGAQVPGDDDDVVMSAMTMGGEGEGGIEGGGISAPGGSAPGAKGKAKKKENGNGESAKMEAHNERLMALLEKVVTSPQSAVPAPAINVTLPKHESAVNLSCNVDGEKFTPHVVRAMKEVAHEDIRAIVKKELDEMKIDVTLNAPVPPAPVVINEMHPSVIPAPQVTINQPSPIVVPPAQVTVTPAPVTVYEPKKDREIEIKRDEKGKITGASISG